MALAKRCDACKEYYDFNKDEEQPNGLTLSYFNEAGQVSHTIVRKELCPKCLAKVNKVLNKED